MDSDEHIPEASPLEKFPTEILSKIVSFLPLHERCRLEGVNQQLSKVAKLSWDKLQLKKLWISSISIDSAPKLLTLLRRCGSQLEEMLTERHIQLDCEYQLDRLCPNLKVLSFAYGSSLSLARDKSQPEVPIAIRVRQLLASLSHLERLQFFGTIVKGNEGNSVVTIKDIIPDLIHVQSLQELHLPLTWMDWPILDTLRELQQLRVLSLTVPTDLYGDSHDVPRRRYPDPIIQSFVTFIGGICQLYQLEELQLRLSEELTEHFTPIIVGRLAASLPSLRSLVLVFGSGKSQIQSDSISTLIDRCDQLRTLVVVCQLWTVVDLRVHLSPFRHRHVPLNIFVVDYCQPSFVGTLPLINVIPMPNDQPGDAVNFLSTYRQNGFDFGTEKCLQMVKMSKEVGGIWDFAYERE